VNKGVCGKGPNEKVSTYGIEIRITLTIKAGMGADKSVARSNTQHFTFTTQLYLINDNKYRSLVT
jgi:hypothetical protein